MCVRATSLHLPQTESDALCKLTDSDSLNLLSSQVKTARAHTPTWLLTAALRGKTHQIHPEQETDTQKTQTEVQQLASFHNPLHYVKRKHCKAFQL